jgi:hypothetical protein
MTDAAARLNHVAWWRGGVAGGGKGSAGGDFIPLGVERRDNKLLYIE